jgi:hemoglobin
LTDARTAGNLDRVGESVYDAAGGMPAMVRLAHAWHERCLADPVVSHAFSHGFHPDHSARLAAYWAEALGGPSTYSDTIAGETTVVRMHSGNGEHGDMDRRALECFVLALDDAKLPDDTDLRDTLTAYFAWGIGEMNRYHRSPDDVPDGLRIRTWSWDGLED